MRLAAASFLLLLAAASRAAAAPQPCQVPRDAPATTVSAEWKDAGYVVDDRHGPGTLAVLSRQAGIHEDGITRGLTSAREAVLTSLPFTSWDDGGGGICVMPARATVLVGFQTPQIVYVQAGDPEGSCPRRVILEHEWGHVRINREVLYQHMVRFQAAVARALSPAQGWPRRIPDEASARRALQDEVGLALAPELTYYRQRRDAMHGILDSPESYRATSMACSAW